MKSFGHKEIRGVVWYVRIGIKYYLQRLQYLAVKRSAAVLSFKKLRNFHQKWQNIKQNWIFKLGKWIHFSKFCKKWVVFRSPNELKLAKAFSSVTPDDKKKSYTKSFPKSVSNSSFPFTTKLPIDINSAKSSTTEITQSELCQKCRRAVDRYSKCSGRFNFWIFRRIFTNYYSWTRRSVRGYLLWMQHLA